MKVIVAGLPKTGTKSIHWALDRLGYSVYDYLDNSILLNKEYENIVNEGWKTEDFQQMYESVDAAVDMPICIFWEEISKAFPDAKIVLTIRDDEESWLRSFVKQMDMLEGSVFLRCALLLSPSFARSHRWMDKLFRLSFGVAGKPTFTWKDQYNKSMFKKMYRAHNAYVMQNAPKDRLLVFNCSDGWEPLCKFLGIPVPNEPFPHRNRGGNVVNEAADFPVMSRIKREMIQTSALLLTAAVVTGVGVWKYGIQGIADFVHRCTEIFSRE